MLPSEELEQNLADVALALFATGSVERSLQLTVDLAVATVDGCDAAGIFVSRDGRVTTVAVTDPIGPPPSLELQTCVAKSLFEAERATDEPVTRSSSSVTSILEPHDLAATRVVIEAHPAR